MTENKSAMEMLREHANKYLSSGMYHFGCIDAMRAVLAEHDAAQKVPPSERAREWREKADRILHAYATGETSGTWLTVVIPVLDEAVRNWGSAPPVPPSEAAKAWKARAIDACGFYATLHASPPADPVKIGKAWDAVVRVLDEAVRLMSQQPAEEPKRLRAGWREAMLRLWSEFAVTDDECRARLRAMLDEAEASAAPEPRPKDARPYMVESMRNELERARATIDALTLALLAAQGRQP